MIYQFKDRPLYNRSKLDAQAIGERLGQLPHTPADIVEDARDPLSPLHPAFDWNISPERAIQEYHEDQARRLVQAIEIVTEGGQTAPAFVSVVVGSGARAYLDTTTALASVDTAPQVLEEARRGLSNWRTRYGALQEFRSVVKAIDEVLDKVPV